MNTKPSNPTPADRKRAERARYKAAGLKIMPEVWLLPAQRARYMQLVEALRRESRMLS